MKFVKKYKPIIIISLLFITYVLFHRYWYLSIVKKVNESILSDGIMITSFLVIAFLMIPRRESILNFLRRNKEVLLLSIYIFVLDFVFVLENNLDYSHLFFFSLFFIIYIIIFMILTLPQKFKSIYYYIILIFIPIYLIIQTFYVPIFNDFFSVNEIFTLKEGMEFANGVLSFNPIVIFYVIMPVIAIIIYNKIKTNRKIKINKNLFFMPIVLFILIIFNAQYPIKQARLYTSDHYLFDTVYSNKRFISRFGVTNYIIRDTARFLLPDLKSKNNYTQDINKYFKEHEKAHPKNEYTGIFENKNLVFIMGESFDYMSINETLTPNIYRIKNEGLDFENHFVPVYPRTTCDSEIIYNTSIIPSITDGPTCYTFNKNYYRDSLANVFKEKGYITRAFHSNEKEFYTRSLVYKGFGYDKFYGQRELKLSNTEKRYDSIFFDKAKDYILPTDDKFMSFVITLSGHSPYESENLAVAKHYDEVKQYFDKLNKTIPDKVMAYMATQMELDAFVGKLLNELKDRGILDDTVIVLTSDHYPYTLSEDAYETYTGIKEKYLKNKAPFVIWSNGIKPQKISELSQSFDMLPTIANLFNLPVDYTYYFGNDIFDKNRVPIAYFKDYSWFDGKNYALFGKHVTGDGNLKYIEKTTETVDTYFDTSIKILRSNYFNKNR